MSNGINKAIKVGACVTAVTITSKAIQKIKKQPVQEASYTVASTMLWLYCIKTTTNIITSI